MLFFQLSGKKGTVCVNNLKKQRNILHGHALHSIDTSSPSHRKSVAFVLLYIHFTLSLRILSFETFLVIGAENAVGCKFSVTNVDPSSFPRRDSKHNSISTVHGNFLEYPDFQG